MCCEPTLVQVSFRFATFQGRWETRPITIPASEDTIVQKATVEVLNAIYEQNFSTAPTGSDPDGEHTKRWMKCDE